MMIENAVILATPSSHAGPDTDEQQTVSAGAGSRDRVSLAPEVARTLLSAHTGKLAIGVAATLGMMIYYNWRERRLAKQDPEGHARLQRLKARVRSREIADVVVLPAPSRGA